MSAPSSTYRLQIRPLWDLQAAAGVCQYLADLGVGAVYLSPLLPSVTGSEHGYDVIAWDRVDPQRGGEDGWQALLAAARSHELRVVVDIVPNHCAASPENKAWSSVLMDGSSSPYAHWFDIEWALPDGGIARPPDGDRIAHYRRFFAVDGLAGLRVEDMDVLHATHRAIRRWIEDDRVDGLRVDHPDGLADPLGYFQSLRRFMADGQWLIVEKILEPGENLPEDWPVDGTTGYDALAEIAPLFVDPDARAVLTQTYRALTDDQLDSAAHIRAGKAEVARSILRPEVERLARLRPDLGADAITDALVSLPVYRTYERWADEYTTRFQQTSGAVMAKGVEDTAYYRYTRFVALNEVGGDPQRLGGTPARFHAAQRQRQGRAPESMTTLSTHDTKRSEDVRARLAVLAELPEEWTELAGTLMERAPLPDGPFAYLLWQTFVGAGFIARERMHGYVEKAMREAGTSTTWVSPDTAFESLVHATVDRGYDDPAVRGPLEAFITRITPYGWSNSLSQKLVQLTMPGVPDVYQGTEVWDDSLVDPDNRRPVDFAALAARLAALDAADTPPHIDATGDAKLWVTSRALRLRRDRPELSKAYHPITVEGPGTEHAVAFNRGHAVTVATRLPVGLESVGGWRDTTVSLNGAYTDVLTGRTHKWRTTLAELLATYPVALLRAEGEWRRM